MIATTWQKSMKMKCTVTPAILSFISLDLQREKHLNSSLILVMTWEFNCKVLRIVYEDTKDAELIRAVGEPPEQYPDYDDFEDDE